jgi:Fe-S-cluster containining protein
MIEQLPCSACTGLCCGPVGLSEARMDKIRAHVKTMPRRERRRLAVQRRDALDCGFLDMESHTCAIYPVRPFVCEAFGRVQGMVCPVVGHLVRIMPAFEEETRRSAAIEEGIETISNAVDWLSI